MWKVVKACLAKAWTHIQNRRTTLTHLRISPSLSVSSSTYCLLLHTDYPKKSQKSTSFQPCVHMRFVPDVKSRWKESIRNFVTAVVKDLTGQNMTRLKYGTSSVIDGIEIMKKNSIPGIWCRQIGNDALPASTPLAARIRFPWPGILSQPVQYPNLH